MSDRRNYEPGSLDIAPASILPGPADWNAAIEHSLANPAHILGPYQDADSRMQMCCDGDGDPYEPSNCGFDTAVLSLKEAQ